MPGPSSTAVVVGGFVFAAFLLLVAYIYRVNAQIAERETTNTGPKPKSKAARKRNLKESWSLDG